MAAVRCPRCGFTSAGFICVCGFDLQAIHDEENAVAPLPPALYPGPFLPVPDQDNPYDDAARRFAEARQNKEPAAPSSGPGLGFAIFVALGGGALGAWAGNTKPLWGGFLEKTLAEPGSPVRLQLAYEHGAAGAALGLVVGMLAALLLRRSA